MNASIQFSCSPSPPPLWHMIFDLSAPPDRAEVWPSERRGAEAVDPGHHWSLHWRRLPERVEERSCSLRVRSAAALGATEMSHALTVEPFWFALKTLPSAPLSWLPFSLEKCPTPHPPSRRSTVVFMGLKSIFLFLSGLLTIWPQALWKRSTIPFSTGIRWVSGHLLSAEVFGQCLFVFFGGLFGVFFHSRWFKLGGGEDPHFQAPWKSLDTKSVVTITGFYILDRNLAQPKLVFPPWNSLHLQPVTSGLLPVLCFTS